VLFRVASPLSRIAPRQGFQTATLFQFKTGQTFFFSSRTFLTFPTVLWYFRAWPEIRHSANLYTCSLTERPFVPFLNLCASVFCPVRYFCGGQCARIQRVLCDSRLNVMMSCISFSSAANPFLWILTLNSLFLWPQHPPPPHPLRFFFQIP